MRGRREPATADTEGRGLLFRPFHGYLYLQQNKGVCAQFQRIGEPGVCIWFPDCFFVPAFKADTFISLSNVKPPET